MGIKEIEILKASKQIIKAVGEGLMHSIDMDHEIKIPVPLTDNEICVKVYTQVRGNERYKRCEKYESLFRRIENNEEVSSETVIENA